MRWLRGRYLRLLWAGLVGAMERMCVGWSVMEFVGAMGGWCVGWLVRWLLGSLVGCSVCCQGPLLLVSFSDPTRRVTAPCPVFWFIY